MNYVRNILNKTSENLILRSIVVVILFLPVIATLGQYISSGFISETTSVAVLYWPGVNGQVSIILPAFIIIGTMLISYVSGIIFMYKRKTIVKAIILGLLSMAIAQYIGSLFNSFTGWSEMQHISDVAKSGVMNRLILSLWHDPVWEEIVFTGIPLIIINVIKKRTSSKTYKAATIAYYILPSILMAIYHIPNHGLSRIPDTLISHAASLWLALRYSFWAPLVLHYVEDAFMIISIDKAKGVPLHEISWIVQNSSIFNTVFTICIISFLVLMIILYIWYLCKEEKIKDNFVLIRKIIGTVLIVFLLVVFYIANNIN